MECSLLGRVLALKSASLVLKFQTVCFARVQENTVRAELLLETSRIKIFTDLDITYMVYIWSWGKSSLDVILLKTL